jgi:hypothetical protein
MSGYVILPLAGLYKPIWEYDARTLADDLSAHLVRDNQRDLRRASRGRDAEEKGASRGPEVRTHSRGAPLPTP